MNDYTRFPIGTKFGPSVVEECPHCHRRGLAVKTTGGSVSYEHFALTGYGEDGHLLSGWDSCPKPDSDSEKR